MTFIKPGAVKKPCIMIVERTMPNNIQGDEACAYTGDPGWQNWDGNGADPKYPLAHSNYTKYNYLFSDDHVELLAPNETVPVATGGGLRVLPPGSMWRRD
jgi:hypothetical protein